MYETDNNGIFFFFSKRLAQTYGNEIAVFIRCESLKDIRAYKTYNDKKISAKDRNTIQGEDIDALYNSDYELVDFYKYVIDNYADKIEPYVIENSGELISIDSKDALMDVVIPIGSNGYRYVNFKLKSLVWNLVAKYIRDSNYDGLIYTDETLFSDERGDALVVYDSNQIKLADGTNTTFDPSNPDIRYEDGGNIGSDCREYIARNEAVLRTGYYLDLKELASVVDPYGQVPLNLKHTLITYNSGNQGGLSLIDTINPISLRDELSKVLSISRNNALALVYIYMEKGKKLQAISDIEGDDIIIFDRDRIVCKSMDEGDSIVPSSMKILHEEGGEIGNDIILQTAQEIKNALTRIGYDVSNGAYSKTSFGHSKYLYANYEDRSMDNHGNGIKIRISDHSTTNPYRMSEEVHVYPTKDNIQQSVDSAVKDIEFRLRKELFDPIKKVKKVDHILVVGENEVNPETDEILNYEGVSKRGGKKYKIKRSLEKSYVTWAYKDSRNILFEDGGEMKKYPQPPSNKGDYISEPAYKEVMYGFYTNPDGSMKSSRFVPYEGPLPPVGTWRMSTYASLDGHEIDYLTRIPLDTLVTKELDEFGRLDPAKRGDDERYADWIRQGYRSIPIEVVQHEDGRLIITDGHRRYLAHKLAGEKDIEAWVSYTVQSPRNTPVGLTYELAYPEAKEMEPEKQIMLPDTQASYEGLKPILANQGYELRKVGGDIGRLAKGMTLSDIAAMHGMSEDTIRPELELGIETEMEHTTDREIARKIAMDHLYEDPAYYTKLKKMESTSYAKGGRLDPDNPSVKGYFAGGSGDTGGVLVGKRHSEGGIKAINKSTGQPIEMEGGEVVITRDAVSDETKREFEGEMLTNREILSRINQSGGGVSFEDGGHVCNCTGRSYKYGGKVMEDYDIIREMARGGMTDEQRRERMKAHLRTLESRVIDEPIPMRDLTEDERWLLYEFKKGRKVVQVDGSRVEMFDGLMDDHLIYFTPSVSSECQDARLTDKGKRYIGENHIRNFAHGGKTDCGCGMYKKGGETPAASEGEEKMYFKGIGHAYKNQFELNKAIEEFMAAKKGRPYTSEEKKFISYFAGYGGLIKYGAEGKGILYEYYTPSVIARKMWALAYKYGYNGGTILEPAVGIGEFLKYAPQNAAITAYEISKVSSEICRILYPGANVITGSFESLFISKNLSIKGKVENLKKYDLVIGNPPYGEYDGYYSGMGEKQYTAAQNWIDYFIHRGLDVLHPKGLLIYIIGGIGNPWLSFDNKAKRLISEKAVLLDAYRLPNGLFDTTEVQTDIIVLQKR